MVVLRPQFFYLPVLVLDCDHITVQVLLLLTDSLFNDSRFLFPVLLLLQQILRPGLTHCRRLLSILIVSLHIIVLFLELLDLFLMVGCVLGLLFRQFFHIFLQLHDRAGDRDVFRRRRRLLLLIARRLPSLFGALEAHLNVGTLVLALVQG